MKKQIILFNDLSSKEGFVRTIGPYRLATELRKNNYSVQVIDMLGMWLEDIENFKKLITSLIDKNTLFIGISTTFFYVSDLFRSSKATIEKDELQNQKLLEILGFIKNINPKIKIVLGGANTAYYNKNIDIKIIGYADSEIVKIANELKNKRYLPVKVIDGIDIRDNDVKACNFDFYNSKTIWDETDCINNNEILPIEISRGCIFKCKFCAYPLNGKKKLDYWRNKETLKEEFIRNYELYKTQRYIILDDTFNDSIEKLKDIKEIVESLNFKIRFVCYLRLDLLIAKKESIQILADMGLEYVYFGIETFNDETGKLIGKGLGKEKTINALKYVKDIWGDKVNIHTSMVAGLPRESKSSMSSSLSIINTMPEIYSTSWMPLFINNTKSKDFLSDIDKDPVKFGYTISIDPKNKNFLYWTNEHMSYKYAYVFAGKANENTRNNKTIKLNGFKLYSLLNIGIDIKSEINKNIIEKELFDKKLIYFNNYKNKLFSLYNL